MTNILLIGCGKMGGALLSGWLKARLAQKIVVIELGPMPYILANEKSIDWLSDSTKLADSFKPDAVVLAIKPQMMQDALPPYRRFNQALFVSIAAGRTLASLASILGAETAIVRTMPNLPASISQGITAGIASQCVTATQRGLAERILSVVGEYCWVEQEAWLDHVTAVSGSGPAYVFLLVEAMAAAGEKLGLPADLAIRLARQTIVGSGALLKQSPQTAAELRAAVTSPKGTTQAALDVLMADHGLTQLMEQAIKAASKRGQELAQ